MVEACEFIEPLRARGIHTWTGVPCSYLTPFINYVIGQPQLRYIASANEGDAVATAAGVALAGGRAGAMMQNSGLGNAVSPLTSLTWTFRLPVLLICTQRGAPNVPDEPQHALMGAITRELFELMRVPLRDFPGDPGEVGAAIETAVHYMEQERRPFALLMQKNAVAPCPLPDSSVDGAPVEVRQQLHGFAGARASRAAVLERLVACTTESSAVIIATTGYTGRELYMTEDRPNHFYMAGSMGCASALGLGVALERPDQHVIVVDGDGAALMRLGNLSTIGTYAGDNLTHIVLDNEVHESTGGQRTVSARVDFARMAAACGYRSVLSGVDLSLIDAVCGVAGLPGPRLLHLKINPGTPAQLPRPALTPEEVAARFTARLVASR